MDRLYLFVLQMGDPEMPVWIGTPHKISADYRIILDAVTDAYISGKKIALFVNSTDEEGTIEQFKFGHLALNLKTIMEP